MIDLTFFGRGAAFYPVFHNTNAYFRTGEELYFLDFGESTFERAAPILDQTDYRHATVLLTHLHADHAGSLPSLCSYMAMVLHMPLRIVHPSPAVLDFLRITGIDPSFYEWLPALPDGDPVSASAYPVQHAKDMSCYGYVLSDGKDRIYFSGDAHEPPQAVLSDFLSGKIARLYHDTASHESQGHCYYGTLCKLIPPERRKEVFCMHLDGDYENLLLQKGFSVVRI